MPKTRKMLIIQLIRSITAKLIKKNLIKKNGNRRIIFGRGHGKD